VEVELVRRAPIRIEAENDEDPVVDEVEVAGGDDVAVGGEGDVAGGGRALAGEGEEPGRGRRGPKREKARQGERDPEGGYTSTPGAAERNEHLGGLPWLAPAPSTEFRAQNGRRCSGCEAKLDKPGLCWCDRSC
jgi:hypothetical protein